MEGGAAYTLDTSICIKFKTAYYLYIIFYSHDDFKYNYMIIDQQYNVEPSKITDLDKENKEHIGKENTTYGGSTILRCQKHPFMRFA